MLKDAQGKRSELQRSVDSKRDQRGMKEEGQTSTLKVVSEGKGEATVEIRGQVHPREICRFCRELQQGECGEESSRRGHRR